MYVHECLHELFIQFSFYVWNNGNSWNFFVCDINETIIKEIYKVEIDQLDNK